MIEKLFYQDPYISEFEASIIDMQEDKKGSIYITLDRTAFYPTGGGQPNDTGTISGVEVVNVEEVDGEIRHYLKSPIQSDSKTVSCVIDWERRFDHMQQHSGQHILSAAFADTFQLETVGFHLGREMSTIDLDGGHLSKETVKKAEKLANQIIFENRPIETKWVSPEELREYPLRKKVAVEENIRLVIIPEYDYNGCGGTHPANTGEVGSLKVIGWERNKGGTRLTFVCGSRVIEKMESQLNVLQEMRKQLNSDDPTLPEKVASLLEEKKMLDSALKDASEQLLQYEANDLVEASSSTGDYPIIKVVFRERGMKDAQKLSQIILEKTRDAIVLIVLENEDKLQIVCSRGKDASPDMNSLVKSVLPSINGKGGGNSERAQGGAVTDMSGEKVLDLLLSVMQKSR